MRLALCAVGLASGISPHATAAYLALAAGWLATGRRRLLQSALVPLTIASIAFTVGVHGVFFGGGRYALGVLPLVGALAALPLSRIGSRRIAASPLR